MKKAFKEINFKPASHALLVQCSSIIAEFQAQGLLMTLRQLYYQLVSRDIIPNIPRSYKNLGSLVSDGRLAGILDWSAIEDRGRQPILCSEFTGLEQLVDAACHSYRLPRWADQENYVELWVEKDALSGVLRPLASRYHVTMMVNKGYSSQSAMHESANRFIENCEGGKKPILLYLGDLDPSGEDMVRDIEARLKLFGVNSDDGVVNYDIDVRKIALTPEQVEQYNPPPNPAKMTDTRAAAYVAEHGSSSWEVDALPPNVLNQLIIEAVEELVDLDMYEAVKAKEELGKDELRKATKKLVKKLKE
ncbi:MAG: hypothetical protein GZ088_09430 [Acidipila sp.]|nr:hypothetical protein [Acidipila sp.]